MLVKLQSVLDFSAKHFPVSMLKTDFHRFSKALELQHRFYMTCYQDPIAPAPCFLSINSSEITFYNSAVKLEIHMNRDGSMREDLTLAYKLDRMLTAEGLSYMLDFCSDDRIMAVFGGTMFVDTACYKEEVEFREHNS